MSTRTCRRCKASYRPDKTPVTDKRGKLLGYAESAWPWCPSCTEVIDAVINTVAGPPAEPLPDLHVVGADGRRRSALPGS